MSRTLLYTGYNDAYKPLADITVPRMAEYAERHGMDFHCYTEPIIDVPNGIYWTGVCGALKAFEEGYEQVIYLDVDQLVTNFDLALPKMRIGFHASKDWGEDAIEPWHFSMCGFFMTNDLRPECISLICEEPKWRDKPFPEQAPMQELYKRIPQWFTIHPRKVFNCVPDQICPGKVQEPWTPGNLAAHLTMLSIERRIEIAKEILLQL